MESTLILGIPQMSTRPWHGRETVLPYTEGAFYFRSRSGGFGVKISLQWIGDCAIYQTSVLTASRYFPENSPVRLYMMATRCHS